MRAAILAVVLALAPAAGAQTFDLDEVSPYWKQHGCKQHWRSTVAKARITALLRNRQPVEAETKARVGRYATCVATRRKAHRLHGHARGLWAWRHTYANRWPIRLNRMPAGWVAWARNITSCESGWNRYASNGSHFSYFQFSAPTWAAASAGFDPPASIYDASWPHQAVIAIHWAWRAGISQWVCVG